MRQLSRSQSSVGFPPRRLDQFLRDAHALRADFSSFGQGQVSQQVFADKFAMRKNPSQWQNGRFVHPHDACFDAEGNIFIAEWVATGRVTKLKKLS